MSSGNFPHFDLNPNTGEPDGRSTRTRVANNAVFCDRRATSRVWLPIVPTA